MGKKKQRNPDKLKINKSCHCVSGKNIKPCCKNKSQPIAPNQMKVILPSEISPELLELLHKKKIVEEQRIAHQGFGKPIIATEFNGRRLVAIGSEIFDAGNCKTFHEVLLVYLRVLLGEEWIKEELEKEHSVIEH